jgi:hypothetical protein
VLDHDADLLVREDRPSILCPVGAAQGGDGSTLPKIPDIGISSVMPDGCQPLLGLRRVMVVTTHCEESRGADDRWMD